MTATSFRSIGYAALALAALLAPTDNCLAADADPDKPTLENVAYGQHERNVLDLWLARSDRPTPLLIFMHGGGFRQGDKGGCAAGR